MDVRREISVCDKPAARSPLISSVVALIPPLYANSHSLSMPHRIIHGRIVLDVKQPHELVHRLVEDAKGSYAVARAMKAPNFQGTLFKFCAGKVAQPTRETAERIANHFGIPVDAIYDPKVATKVWRERFEDGAKGALSEPPPPPRDFSEARVVSDPEWQLILDLRAYPKTERDGLANKIHARAEEYRAVVREYLSTHNGKNKVD